MTSSADNLRDYYADQEVAIFSSTEDLINQAKELLKDTSKREAIALAGYRRTLAEHTYEKRFNEIFKAMGLI